jgi:hypothetical protein
MKGDNIMSLTTSEMTPADIRACTCGNDGYNNGGMFGNDWAWIVILLLFGWGGRGFGGFGGGFGGNGGSCGCSPCATQADLAAGFNNSAVLNNLDGIENALCQGFNGVNTALLQGFAGVDNAVCTLGYNVQGGFNALSAQLAQCCCDNRAAIADVKYTIANEGCDTRHTIYNSTRDIIDNANANSRAILDFLTQDKIATLTAENQSLKFAASQSAQNAFITANQEAQTATLLRRLGAECPQPAYVVQPPQPVTFPTNCCGTVNFASNGCGCGSY